MKARFFDEMKGHIYRRGCKCKKKKCTCGSKWAFMVDIGIDPVTGKRKQKGKGGLGLSKRLNQLLPLLFMK